MKLIIINGPCGIGKSTLAHALHESIPLSFLIDVDLIRRHVSGYREYREESGHLSHLIALAILTACFKEGRDVILDKMLFDSELIDAYRAIADEHHADIYEFILWAPKEIVMARAGGRGWKENGLLTPEKCELFWQKIDQLKDKRPQAKAIDTTLLTEVELLRVITKVIDNK